MQFRIIQSPSEETLNIVLRRAGLKRDSLTFVDSIGLVQGKMIDLICAADIVEKTVDVKLLDIKGVCPQHMTMLGILGDTAAVKTAIEAIKNYLVKEQTI